jgi:hypothetical protein
MTLPPELIDHARELKPNGRLPRSLIEPPAYRNARDCVVDALESPTTAPLAETECALLKRPGQARVQDPEVGDRVADLGAGARVQQQRGTGRAEPDGRGQALRGARSRRPRRHARCGGPWTASAERGDC